jgi:quinol monooxygenase YgiN
MRSFIRLVLGIALSLFAMTSADAADATFYTVTYVEVGVPSTAQGAAVVRQHADATRQAAGAVRVEAVQRVDRPNQFAMLVGWSDQKAFEAHQAAEPMREFRDRLRPLLASPNDDRLHHGLSVGPPASSPAGALYVVTHVDVIPPRKDDAVAALKQLADESRKDAGHVRFDVVQQTNRPNHFTVVEVWATRAAFDAHGMAAHVRRFRDQLGPMSGSLYDERLYAILN